MIDEDRSIVLEALRMRIAETIRRCKKGAGEKGKPWCLYAKSTGRLLGRHESKEDAQGQERAIKSRG